MNTNETYAGADILAIVRAHFAVSGAAAAGLTPEQAVASGRSYNDTAMDLLLHMLSVQVPDTENGTLEECCEELSRCALNTQTDLGLGVRVREYESGAREVSWGFGDDYGTTVLRDLLQHAQLPADTVPAWFDGEWVEVFEYGTNGGRWVTKASLEALD
ncbi:hypothetical protein OKW41_006298 [Paraburkholderia sp. UCT70]|uniref:hypothetical protein n=1 Tax=Paraburkholderia sp. UCT70 TaxID=2991068 RepID=UPI003D1AE07E